MVEYGKTLYAVTYGEDVFDQEVESVYSSEKEALFKAAYGNTYNNDGLYLVNEILPIKEITKFVEEVFDYYLFSVEKTLSRDYYLGEEVVMYPVLLSKKDELCKYDGILCFGVKFSHDDPTADDEKHKIASEIFDRCKDTLTIPHF